MPSVLVSRSNMSDSPVNSVPRISVLMATHGDALYLSSAVESILTQTFVDFEFIVINNGLTARPLQYLQSLTDLRISIITNVENVGLTRALNQGLAVARGAYIARMDDDDISLPERFARESAFLQDHPEISVVGSAIILMEHNGTTRNTKSCFTDPEVIRFRLTVANQLAHSSVMMRSEVLRSIGGYDESFRFAQDLELWGRMSRAGYRFSNIPTPLVRYRVHGSSSTQGTTRKDAYGYGIAAIRANMTPYITLSDTEFTLWLDAFIHHTIPDLRTLLMVQKIWATLGAAYMARESPAPHIVQHIRTFIHTERRVAFKMFLKVKLGGLYGILRALSGR